MCQIDEAPDSVCSVNNNGWACLSIFDDTIQERHGMQIVMAVFLFTLRHLAYQWRSPEVFNFQAHIDAAPEFVRLSILYKYWEQWLLYRAPGIGCREIFVSSEYRVKRVVGLGGQIVRPRENWHRIERVPS